MGFWQLKHISLKNFIGSAHHDGRLNMLWGIEPALSASNSSSKKSSVVSQAGLFSGQNGHIESANVNTV